MASTDAILPPPELRKLGRAVPESPRTVTQQLVRSPSFLTGSTIVVFWIVCAVFGTAFAPRNPLAQNLLDTNARP